MLTLLRRRALGGTEIALYWLGTSVALTPAVSALFTAAGWRGGTAAAVGLAAAAALMLAALRGRALSVAELVIYGLGLAPGIVYAAHVTYWY